MEYTVKISLILANQSNELKLSLKKGKMLSNQIEKMRGRLLFQLIYSESDPSWLMQMKSPDPSVPGMIRYRR